VKAKDTTGASLTTGGAMEECLTTRNSSIVREQCEAVKATYEGAATTTEYFHDVLVLKDLDELGDDGTLLTLISVFDVTVSANDANFPFPGVAGLLVASSGKQW